MISLFYSIWVSVKFTNLGLLVTKVCVLVFSNPCTTSSFAQGKTSTSPENEFRSAIADSFSFSETSSTHRTKLNHFSRDIRELEISFHCVIDKLNSCVFA